MALLHKKTIEETNFGKGDVVRGLLRPLQFLKLTLVYDDLAVFNEILQIDDDSYPPPAYRTVTSHH